MGHQGHQGQARPGLPCQEGVLGVGPPSAGSGQAARARVRAPAPARAGQRLRPDAGSPSSHASLSPVPGPRLWATLSNPDMGFSGDQRQHPFRERLLAPSWSAAGQPRPFVPAAPNPREGRGAALPLTIRRNEGGRPWAKEAARSCVYRSFRAKHPFEKAGAFMYAHARSFSLDRGVWFRGGSRAHCCRCVLLSRAWSWPSPSSPCSALTG